MFYNWFIIDFNIIMVSDVSLTETIGRLNVKELFFDLVKCVIISIYILHSHITHTSSCYLESIIM